MSYILDALKKSAEERRRVQKPAPLLYGPPVQDNSDGQVKQTVRPLLATLLLALALLIAAGWYWRAARPFVFSGPATTTVQHNQPETPPASTNTTSQLAPSPSPEPPPTTTQLMANEPRPTAVNQVREQTPVPTSRQLPQPPLVQDLPASVQATLPDIRFSGHVFSPEPSLRMIMANQAIVREQDLVSPEVRLEEITETGVLLSYRGTRFRVELLPPL